MARTATPSKRKPPKPKAPRKGPGGPRTKRTPETAARICALVGRGMPRGAAAELAGISTGTFYDWTRDDPEFLERINNAENALHERAAAAVMDILDCDEATTRLNAAKFVLTHKFPQHWSSRQEVRHQGPDGGPVQVEATVRPAFTAAQLAAMTPEQLAAALTVLKS